MKFEEKRKMITESKTQDWYSLLSFSLPLDERSQGEENRVSIFMLRGKKENWKRMKEEWR